MNRSILSGHFVTAITLVLAGCGQGASQPPAAPESSASVPPPQTAVANPEPAPASSPAMEPAAGTAPSSSSDQTAKRAVLTDDQIAAITDAANTAEIDQAKVAQTKAKDARVKKFAKMMITHHGKAKQDQTQLKIAPKESAISTDLSAQSANKLSVLKSASAPDFDRAYIDGQVEAHREVLNLFDAELIPNASNAELKKMLQDFRPRIAEHLAEAQQIQTALSAQPATSSSVSGSGSMGSGSTGAANKAGSGSNAGATGAANKTGSGSNPGATGSSTNPAGSANKPAPSK